MAPLKKTSISLAPAVEELVASYGATAKTSSVLALVADRYTRILDDARRTMPKFTDEEIQYLFRQVAYDEIPTDGRFPLHELIKFCLSNDLAKDARNREENDSQNPFTPSAPSTSDEMLDRLRGLTVAQQIALIEEFQKEAMRHLADEERPA